ncbi:MAG: energy transducer TonB [Bacteroidetes bacterium]|nr:energy transducer TonB [Bacteroidota bacterium]
MKSSKLSWFVSVVIHGCILILLAFLKLPQALNHNFVEVLWGTPTSSVPFQNVNQQMSESTTAEQVSSKEEIQTSVSLPTRRMPDLSNEVFSATSVEKQSETVEPQTYSRKQGESYGEAIAKQQYGQQSRSEKPFPSLGNTLEGSGSSLPKGVEYSLEWQGGGTRSKISGELPHYPKGVTVSAQIRLQVSVRPDGTVSSVIPIQKAEPRLEAVAINEVKKWKFQPLDRKYPQVEQLCIVTFYFIAQ